MYTPFANDVKTESYHGLIGNIPILGQDVAEQREERVPNGEHYPGQELLCEVVDEAHGPIAAEGEMQVYGRGDESREPG
jgi:hypothetical protein